MQGSGPWLTARAPLIVMGAALLAWSLALSDGPGANIPRYVALTVAASGASVAALRLVLGLDPRWRRLDLALIFVVACGIRVPLLFSPPSLSDDVYRAVWDARLLHAGVNPYSYPPGAVEVEAYRDEEIWPRVNHKDQRTPYPPLAELLGAAAYAALPERLLAMQLLAAAMDLGSAVLLALILARCGQDPRRCLAVAWSPMGAVHFAHSGHNDASMVAATLAAVLLLTFRRRWLGLAALGAATAIKGVPALMLPAFLRATGPAPVAAWAGAGALATAPFLGAGWGLVAGALEEAGGQRFNESVHLLVERAAQPALGEGAGWLATAVGLAVVLAVVGLFVRRPAGRPHLASPTAMKIGFSSPGGGPTGPWVTAVGEGVSGPHLASPTAVGEGLPSPMGALVGGSWALGAYVLVAAVVEPWYFTWLAPLIAVRLQPGARPWPFASNDGPAWLWLSCTAMLTELTYLPGGSSLWVAIRLVEYGPAYALLGLAAVGWTRRRT